MPKKKNAHALAVVSSQKPFVPVGTFHTGTFQLERSDLDAIGERIRGELDWLESAQKMIPLRAVFLGIVLRQVHDSLDRGEWVPWLRKYFRNRRTNAHRFLKLGDACKSEAQLNLPQLVALRQLEIDFQPASPRDHASKALAKMKRWIGSRTLTELYAAYADGPPKLGGARTAAAAKPVVDLETLKIQMRDEAAGLIERNHALLLRDNILQYLDPEERRNFIANLTGILIELKAAFKIHLKQATA